MCSLIEGGTLHITLCNNTFEPMKRNQSICYILPLTLHAICFNKIAYV